MPEKPGKKVPKIMQAIADALDKGIPISKASELYRYKPEVITKIYQFVKDGEGSDDPIIQKLLTTLGGGQAGQAPPAELSTSQAEVALGPIAKDLQKGLDLNQVAHKHGIAVEEVLKVEDYFNKKIGDDNPVIRDLLKRKAPQQPPAAQQQAAASNPQAAAQGEAAPIDMKKYNPKYIEHREKWADMAEYPVPQAGNKKMKDLFIEAAAKYGLNPDVLYASAMEEGMNRAVKGDKFEFDDLDAFYYFGLDDLDKFKPDVPYEVQERMNDSKTNPRMVKSGFFNTVEDALATKAKSFKYFQDKVNAFLTKNKITDATPDMVDFLTMQAYNAGDGVLPKYLNKYKKEGLWQDGKFLEQDPSGTYEDNQSYVHSRRRFEPLKLIRDKGTFKTATQQTALQP